MWPNSFCFFLFVLSLKTQPDAGLVLLSMQRARIPAGSYRGAATVFVIDGANGRCELRLILSSSSRNSLRQVSRWHSHTSSSVE